MVTLCRDMGTFVLFFDKKDPPEDKELYNPSGSLLKVIPIVIS